eukprot:GHVT01024792.1.p2 GENE.GHVT01024792.1~~GHVT01024792.1.p2  ORF type:complete len:192 (+),score=34.42 GHVT01024792.1:2300-2875(+)
MEDFDSTEHAEWLVGRLKGSRADQEGASSLVVGPCGEWPMNGPGVRMIPPGSFGRVLADRPCWARSGIFDGYRNFLRLRGHLRSFSTPVQAAQHQALKGARAASLPSHATASKNHMRNWRETSAADTSENLAHSHRRQLGDGPKKRIAKLSLVHRRHWRRRRWNWHEMTQKFSQGSVESKSNLDTFPNPSC